MNTTSSYKDIILNQLSPKDICLNYLGIDVLPKGNISSPFSNDSNPSFKLNANGTFKCFSTGKQGDCFQLVADLNSLDIQKDFVEVCKIIAKDLQIDLNQNIAPKKRTESLKSNPEIEKNSLTIEKREFTNSDIAYWGKLGISKALLERYKVCSITNYSWTGKKPIYTKNDSVAFAFELEQQIKLYIPNQPIANIKKNILPPFKDGIFGLEQLGNQKQDRIIICEGEKDTITAVSRGF